MPSDCNGHYVFDLDWLQKFLSVGTVIAAPTKVAMTFAYMVLLLKLFARPDCYYNILYFINKLATEL